ncbi:hypothetical protein WN943_002868 [Citrus x changshan-huyou]
MEKQVFFSGLAKPLWTPWLNIGQQLEAPVAPSFVRQAVCRQIHSRLAVPKLSIKFRRDTTVMRVGQCSRRPQSSGRRGTGLEQDEVVGTGPC